LRFFVFDEVRQALKPGYVSPQPALNAAGPT
jgi:hypothetical protein